MDVRPLIAELDFERLFLGLICLGPPVLCVAWLAWVAIRETMRELAGRKRYGGRRKPRFSLGFLFVFTSAVAVASALFVAGGAEANVISVLYALLTAVVLTAAFYFVVFLIQDVLVDFGWMTPRTGPRGRLLGRRRPAQDPFEQEEAAGPVEIREPEGGKGQGSASETKRKGKRRHWWARVMPNRTRFIGPGKDQNIPFDRDEYAG